MENSIKWMDVTTNPTAVGKYVVETKTTLGNTQKLECLWNGKTWCLSNQVVVKWLKED